MPTLLQTKNGIRSYFLLTFANIKVLLILKITFVGLASCLPSYQGRLVSLIYSIDITLHTLHKQIFIISTKCNVNKPLAKVFFLFRL
jgi:hypothetical protein